MLSRLSLWLLVAASFAGVSSPSYAGRLKDILKKGRAQSPSCLEGLEAVAAETLIETRRFKLKPVDDSDREAVKKIWGDKKVAEVSGDYLEEDDIRALLRIGHPDFRDFTRGAIVNLGIYDGDDLVGMSQLCSTYPAAAILKGDAQEEENWAEISYHLRPDYWSVNGKHSKVATEVATALVEQAFKLDAVRGVHAQAILKNEGSQKVLVNAGLLPLSSDSHGAYFGVTRTAYEAKRREPASGGTTAGKPIATDTSAGRQTSSSDTANPPSPVPFLREPGDTWQPKQPRLSTPSSPSSSSTSSSASSRPSPSPRSSSSSSSTNAPRPVVQQWTVQQTGNGVTFTIPLTIGVSLGAPVLVSPPPPVRSRLGAYPTDGYVDELVSKKFARVYLHAGGVSKVDSYEEPLSPQTPVRGQLAYFYRRPVGRSVEWGIGTITEFYRAQNGIVVLEIYDEWDRQRYTMTSEGSPQFYLELEH